MRRMLVGFAVAGLAAGQALAAAQTSAPGRADVMAAVQQFLDGFNKGDVKAATAACADQTSILDEFPPHEWHGAGACATWMNDYDTDAKKNGITDGLVTLGTPSHVDITADRAYVVVAANYAFKKNGAPVREVGSMVTLALQKGSTGWRITGWSWAKH